VSRKDTDLLAPTSPVQYTTIVTIQ